jgi:hypothetical protein
VLIDKLEEVLVVRLFDLFVFGVWSMILKLNDYGILDRLFDRASISFRGMRDIAVNNTVKVSKQRCLAGIPPANLSVQCLHYRVVYEVVRRAQTNSPLQQTFGRQQQARIYVIPIGIPEFRSKVSTARIWPLFWAVSRHDEPPPVSVGDLIRTYAGERSGFSAPAKKYSRLCA